MIRTILIATIAMTIAGCGSTRVRTVYVPATVPQAFFDPSICIWPDKDQVIVNGTDDELSDYILKGFEAWACERTTRLGAGKRQQEIVSDIEKRSD